MEQAAQLAPRALKDAVSEPSRKPEEEGGDGAKQTGTCFKLAAFNAFK